MQPGDSPLCRRRFLADSLGAVSAAGLLLSGHSVADAAGDLPSHQATGVKVGEVSDTSAIVLMRYSRDATFNAKGTTFPREERARALPKGLTVADLRGACPRGDGRVRLRYGTNADLAGAVTTDWVETAKLPDAAHQFTLTGLKPATVYHFSAETSDRAGREKHASLAGHFETAPRPDEYADATFTVVTGQMYRDLDHADGFHMYPAMAALRPKFYVPTGDNVYYDSDDVRASTIELARHHWHRIHSLPRVRDFHLRVPAYWEKDDHDTYHDDCWPGMRVKAMDPFTFEDGLRIFREQCPMGKLTYRTFRWGRGLQVWLVEGRDYRSPNPAKDGPNKTIWGAEQKKWLKDTLLKSDAVFKVLVSPTPIVGPDRKNKRDNHCNEAFQTEGDEIRRFFQKHLPERFIIACGDRHWQYHSVHPETRVHEFSCGPASDIHAGGSPGLNKEYHRFHRVDGGFLSVAFTRRDGQNTLTMRLHDVMGKVVYQYAMRG